MNQNAQSEKSLPLNEKITLIKSAIKNREKLEIVYLKSKDEKSKRIILSTKIGKIDYLGYRYLGINAYCYTRREERIFRVDKILEIKLLG